MKSLLFFVGMLTSATAHTNQFFISYEEYYRHLSGVLFNEEALEEANEPYSIKGERGLCGEEDTCHDYRGEIGTRKIIITISQTSGNFKINNRQFKYSSARLLPNAKKIPQESPLYGVSVYIAPKSEIRPDMICIDGYYIGSGGFKLTEIFLVINPFDVGGKAQLFHLPNLHSSCLAIKQEPDGAISYPSNSYIPQDDEIVRSTGLLMKYFKLKNGVSTPLNFETTLQFLEPGNPFGFSSP